MNATAVMPATPFRVLQVVTLDSWLPRAYALEAQHALEQALPIGVSLQNPSIDIKPAFDEARGQYNALVLLDILSASPRPTGGRVLGLTTHDLFIPMLAHVFGQGELAGVAAVVSVARFDDRLYGLPDNPVALVERLAKEAIHEVGHICGLVHCTRVGCVMHSSTDVDDIGLKGDRYCEACLSHVRRACSPNLRAS